MRMLISIRLLFVLKFMLSLIILDGTDSIEERVSRIATIETSSSIKFKSLKSWSENLNANKSILIDGGGFHTDPASGGAEAMVQISIAFAKVSPEHVYITNVEKLFSINISYNPYFVSLYGKDLVVKTKSIADLLPGDILIFPEVFACPTVPVDVVRVQYLLSTTRNCKGVKYISHNYHIAKQSDSGLNLPDARIVVPYVSPSIIDLAVQVGGLQTNGCFDNKRKEYLFAMKKNQVLIDNDVPIHITNVIERAIKKVGGTSITLDNMNKSTVLKLYQESKIIIDWCMRGSERCPLEAGLFGNILITNACATGMNKKDFPIAGKYIAPKVMPKDDQGKLLLYQFFVKTFRAVFTNYEDAVSHFDEYRAMILANNAERMRQDVIRFLDTVYLGQGRFPGGCQGC